MGSEMGDSFKEHRQEMKERKEKEGIDCPGCKIKEPKRVPSRLLPGWTCKVCGHKRLSTVNDSGKMKITLSKSQWEEMGRKAGWGTESQPDNRTYLIEASDGLGQSLKLLHIAQEVELWAQLNEINNKILDRAMALRTKRGQI
jgi:ribosomal protein L37AE/L43A